MQIALEAGQHSLAFLLLRSGYRLELEQYAPLDTALEARRWDLVDLLVEWGADLRSEDAYTVLNTYNVPRLRTDHCRVSSLNTRAKPLFPKGTLPRASTSRPRGVSNSAKGCNDFA